MTSFDEDQDKYDMRARPKILKALDILSSHDGHDPHCEVCGYRIWIADGKTMCQKGCPVRPLRMFL